MSVLDLDERRAYLQYLKKHEYGDFTPFYIAVTICTVIAAVIFVINIVLGCCSKHSGYWNDRHTGNRWLISLWTATPHNQPSLDYGEIDERFVPDKVHVHELPRDSTEVSELDYPHSHHHEQYEPKPSRQPPPEYYELQHQKSRESDI